MTVNLQTLIEQDFGYEKSSGKWGRSEQHDSLVLNEETQQWFWNSRGIRGDLKDYLVLVRGYTKDNAERFIKEQNFIPVTVYETAENYSPPYEKLVDLMWSTGKDNREYWYKRLLTDSTIDRFRLGHFDGWNLIPMYEDGVFCNFQCRREVPEKRIKQWYKHGKPILFNGDMLPFLSTVYMTEGTVDAILLTQLGFPAVSQNGTNIWAPEWYGKFSHIKKVYYIEDNDSAGRLASKLISKSLGVERVKIVSYEGTVEKFDTVDFFRSGNSVEDFKEVIENNSHFIYELEDINAKSKNHRRA